MNDLISKQAAIDALTAYMGSNYMMGIVQCIERLPSAQPEITHCSECTHWKHSLARKSYCEVHDWMSKAEDFCSFAERG